MGAIAHYIEDAGVPTTSISLVRENTERIRPPRALWVPFELGRPFGAPNEPEFQLDVVRAVLTLLERTDGNVILKDFPKDAPGQNAADSMDGLACPMRFPVPASGDASKLLSQVLSEISQLAPWHEVFLEKNGRSIAGVSTMPIADAARILDEIRSTGRAASIQETELGTTLRYATEDLRNWYLEAASARPGGSASAKQLADWFWGETTVGELVLALHPVCLASENPGVQHVGRSQLVPRAQRYRLKKHTPSADGGARSEQRKPLIRRRPDPTEL